MKKEDVRVCAVLVCIGIVFGVVALAVESVVITWIFGILSVAILAFSIYASIDCVIKAKRGPEDFAALLVKCMEEESKKPGFEERFTKSIEEGQKRRKLLFESQRPEEESYGYSSDNPIMTSTISSTNEYLSRLRTLDGKGFTWNRTQAYCMKNVGGVDGVWVDVYQLFLNGQEYKVLYICPYGHQSPYAPKGMVLATIE